MINFQDPRALALLLPPTTALVGFLLAVGNVLIIMHAALVLSPQCTQILGIVVTVLGRTLQATPATHQMEAQVGGTVRRHLRGVAMQATAHLHRVLQAVLQMATTV